MITRIELVNFMSHEHTVIEPAEGLTVLVGPNNCGKSAVVTALQILAHNENSTYVLRHGAKEARVAVETSDGHSIEWRRKKTGGPSYVVNGRLYDRLSGNVPEEVQQALRVSKVSSGSGTNREEFDLHFGEQKSPVFLLDQPSSHAARFFASSSDAEKLVRMQSRHKEKVQEAKSERSRLVAEAAELEETLSELSPVDEIERKVTAAEQLHTEMAERQTEIDAGERIRGELDKTARLAASLETEVAALGELPEPPSMHDAPALEAFVENLVAADLDRGKAASESSVLSTLPEAPGLSDTADLERLVGELDSRQRRTQRERRVAELYTVLSPVPDLEDPSELEKRIAELESGERARAQAEAEAWSAEEELGSVREALRSWAVDNRVCPTCGGTVEPEQLLEAVESGLGAHAHGG
ncbi:MAG: AAA family ATPase [Spirochaetota bacterium]